MLTLLMLITLVQSTDAPMIHTIQDILDDYHFTHEYIVDHFDCSDQAQLVWLILKEHNYRPKIFYRNRHTWTGIQDYYSNWLMIETTNPPKSIGIVVDETFAFNYYNASYMFNNPTELHRACYMDPGIVNETTLKTARQTLVEE